MAEEKKPKTKKQHNPLIGSQAQPTVLGDVTQLDIDTKKVLVDNIIEAGLSGGLDISALEDFTSISNSRDQISRLIDTMAQDSTVSSIIRTYSEDVCDVADNGHIIWCESDRPEVSKFINYLLNVMNADKNIFKWAYCLLKYGDVYLKLYRESDYTDKLFKQDKVNSVHSTRSTLNESLDESVNLNVHSAGDPYSYYVEMVPDPGTMFELTKYGKTYGYIEVPNEDYKLNFIDNLTNNPQQSTSFANYKMKSNDVNVYQADDYVHACLDDGFDRFPEHVELFIGEDDYKNNTNAQAYTVRRGKSLLYDSYKIWREKSLLENAALLNRITRSSIVRKVSVEVGDMPKEQVQQTLHRVKDMMEQKSAINTGTGMAEYNNPGPLENNIYFATHEGKGAITVEAVGGDVEVKNLADLDWWNNKFYSSYGIPKQYFGWTDDGAGFNGGTSLTILSSVYSKGVKRVQNAIIQMMTDCINLMLVNRGCSSYLNNFTIKMKAPLTQEELDYRSNFTERISALNSLQGLFTDVEDKVRRLEILKTLISTLNYGDQLIVEINNEIAAAQEAAANAEAADKNEDGEELSELPDLSAMEQFNAGVGSMILNEDQNLDLFTELTELNEDKLPTPQELDDEIDFTENN